MRPARRLLASTGILGTIVLGVVGSFVGGFLQNLIEYHSLSVHSFHAVGLIGSVIGAWVLLLLLRPTADHMQPVRRGSGTSPASGLASSR